MRRPRAALLAALIAVAGCSSAPAPSPPTPIKTPPPTDTVRPSPRADAEALPAKPRPRLLASVRLAFTGDINLGTTTLPDGVPPDSGRGLFDRARPSLAGDLVVGNFEGVLADTGTSVKCGPVGKATEAKPARKTRRSRASLRARPSARPGCYAFRTPTHLAPRLVEAGFTHLNLANNHAHDYGLAGRSSTEATLWALGIELYGPLGQIAIDTIQRGDSLTAVGLVGFTTYPHAYNLLDIHRSAAVVDSVRKMVDLLVVTFHGGTEGITAQHTAEVAESLGSEPRGNLRQWARAVIDAGADAVVGHGPHVLRGIEFYRGKPIAYSLGNFLTYRGFNLTGPLGITGVLQLEYAPDRSLRRARLIPMLQLPRQGPSPDPARTAIDLVRRLSHEDFGPTAAKIANDGEITPP